MSHFLKKFFLFLAPFGLIFILPITVFLLSREYYTIDRALLVEKEHPNAVIGLAYSNISGLKNALVAKNNPTVFALGTSRTGQFRKEFFTASSTFVTASNSVVSIDGMKKFIEELPDDNKTEIVILGLDPNMFLPSYLHEYPSETDYERLKDLFLGRWRNFYIAYFSGRFSIKELWIRSGQTESIGLTGIMREEGFRPDGSYQYRKKLSEPNREELLKSDMDTSISLLRANRSNPYYNQYSDPFSKDVILSLDELLTLCQKKHLYVVAYIPPFPPLVYQELIRLPDGQKENVLQLPAALRETLSRHDFDFYDFSDSTILGKHDNEFIDPSHGTDKYYLRMILYMAERNKRLSEYVDIPKDNKLLQNANKDYLDDVLK